MSVPVHRFQPPADPEPPPRWQAGDLIRVVGAGWETTMRVASVEPSSVEPDAFTVTFSDDLEDA